MIWILVMIVRESLGRVEGKVFEREEIEELIGQGNVRFINMNIDSLLNYDQSEVRECVSELGVNIFKE